MKKILTFACILFPFVLMAQTNYPGYELGYYFDTNKQLIPGYIDFDYQVKDPFKVSCTIGVDFTPGVYYDLDNVPHQGLIKAGKESYGFRFKESATASGQTFDALHSNAYVIGRDSFTVISNFAIERSTMSSKYDARDFALVIGRVGNKMFYKHTRINNNGVLVTYLVKTDGKDGFESFSQDKTKFKATALSVFADVPGIVSQIQKGVYNKDDLPNMVKIYRYYIAYTQKQPIYLSRAWNEVDLIAEAHKYSLVDEIVNDTVFVVKTFFMDGTPISQQNIVSFAPLKEVGESVFFYPNTTIRKIKAPYGKQTKLVYTYAGGQPLCEIVMEGKIPVFSDLNTQRYVTSHGWDYHGGHYCYAMPVYVNKEKEAVRKEKIIIEAESNGIALKNRKWYFEKVYDADGNNVLDVEGAGSVFFFDSIANRKIYWDFVDNRINKAYYLDRNQRKVYQVCDKKAYLSAEPAAMFENLKTYMHYQEYSFDSDARGVALVRCVVEPDGKVSEFELIRSVSEQYDLPINNFFKQASMYAFFTPAKEGKELVPQEVVFPLVFELNTYLPMYNNYYNHSWMFHNQMMQNQMMNTPALPAGFPR
jgi:hypothetical protein